MLCALLQVRFGYFRFNSSIWPFHGLTGFRLSLTTIVRDNFLDLEQEVKVIEDIYSDLATILVTVYLNFLLKASFFTGPAICINFLII